MKVVCGAVLFPFLEESVGKRVAEMASGLASVRVREAMALLSSSGEEWSGRGRWATTGLLPVSVGSLAGVPCLVFELTG